MNTSKTQRHFIRTLPLRVVAAILLAGMTAAPFAGCHKEEKAGGPAPPQVEVVKVTQKDVPIYSEWVGTMDGDVNATIRPQVAGYLIKQDYREGDFVKKGQLLFEIDPRTYQAAVDQAKGVLSQAKATLEQAKAQVGVRDAAWVTAKANLARVKPLAEQNAVSQKDLDDAVGLELGTRAGLLAAKAAVGSAEAAVVAAKASLDKAQLDLDFTKIYSPIDGIAGEAKAQIGNLVGPGSTEELTTVSTVNPIKVYVSISEPEYFKAMKKQTVQQEKRPIEMTLADGSVYPYKGEFVFADRQVDVRTGTIRVALQFPNPNNLLRPGQFARVRVEMDLRKGALVVPQRALSEVQGRYLAAVMDPEDKVSIKPVKSSVTYGQYRVIDEGLQAGQEVVAEGTQKVRDGMVVSPKPFSAESATGTDAGQKPGA